MIVVLFYFVMAYHVCCEESMQTVNVCRCLKVITENRFVFCSVGNEFLFCFSIAVSRSKNVPPFGPTFAKDVRFEKSSTFRDFLLVKGSLVIHCSLLILAACTVCTYARIVRIRMR